MSNLVFERQAQALAPGQSWRLGIQADFFRIASASDEVRVVLLKDDRIIGRMDGWSAGDYVRGVPFDAVEIVNGAAGQTVEVQLAGGGVGSDRVVGEVSVAGTVSVAGEVSVIDGGRSRTEGGAAYMGSLSQGGSAGQYPQVQIWNPAASGYRLYVEQIIVSCSAADGASLYFAAAQLAADVEAAKSKKAGGADSVGRLQREAVTGYPFATQPLAGVQVQASESQMIKLNEPISVEPGYGLRMVGSSVSNAMQVTFEFFQEAV